MSRVEALAELKEKPYDPETVKDDFKYVATKLGISVDLLQNYFDMPKKFYWDYKNSQKLLSQLSVIATKLNLNRAQVR
jgi:hypothetical protein